MLRKLILLFISMVSIFSGCAYAVGLGDYELKSGLNQPLSAKITLLSAGELDEHEVQASLASLQEFEKIGVERLFFLNNIKFETVRANDGSVSIILSSREPIKEPFLNFLIELNWPNGRIIREYTFLLDPPLLDDTTSSTFNKAKSSKQAERQAPQSRRASPVNNSSNEQPSFTGSQFGPISSTDTLWSIASRVKPNSASIHQTLVAIYRANPEAFLKGNINNLKKGAVLNIPNEDFIAQVPHRAALQDVVVQNNQWRSGGARKVVSGSSENLSNQSSDSSPRLSLATPTNNTSTNDSNSAGTTERLKQIEDQLVETKEQSATLQAENEELRARLADALSKLESNQQADSALTADNNLAADSNNDNSSVVNIEDSELAVLSDRQNTPETTNQDNQLKNEQEQTTQANETQEPPPSKNEVKSENKVNNQPRLIEKPKTDLIMGLPTMYWGAIGGVVLLIALAVFWRMRKRMEEEDFQDDLVASAGAGSMDTTETFELPDVGDDMLVELDMDEEQETSMESDDEEFDPLGEADIYIAYGKYDQAENLLKEAIEDNPIRSDLKVKLLECYAETENKDQFDEMAKEVSEAVDADEWLEQVNELSSRAFGESSGATEDFDLPSTEDIFGDDDDLGEVTDFSENSEENNETEADFDLDLEADEVDLDDIDSSESATETFDSLDDEDFDNALDDDSFSLDDSDLDDSDLSDADLDSSDSDEIDEFSLDDELIESTDDEGLEDEIDLDLSEDNLLDDDDFDLEGSDEDSIDLDEDDFDLSDDDGLGVQEENGEDEVATKLDLARAYIDMGDSEGAKEILTEVVSEGNDEQKSEAKDLLNKAE